MQWSFAEDESDSRGALASNSVEMMSPVEPPSESAAAPVQPFTFGAAANAAQPSGLFNFGTAVPVGPTGTSSTGFVCCSHDIFLLFL